MGKAAGIVTLILGTMGVTGASGQSVGSPPVNVETIKSPGSTSNESKPRFGLSYAVFFSGPGVGEDNYLRNPNSIGMPSDDGLYTTNTVSFRYRVTERWSADLQTRTRLVFNDDRTPRPGLEPFRPFRWENPSVGFSGDLARGSNWSLRGAVNTDLPYTMGEPFAGFTSINRTTLAAPGMFASLRYAPTGTNWSFFSIINPRLFIYRDRNAVEPMFLRAGRTPQNKRELDVSFRPAVSYKLSRVFDLTLGSAVSYNKQVGSDWNPLRASTVSNGPGREWRLDPIPLQAGTTINFDKSTRLFAYVQGFPIESQRFDGRTEVRRTVPFEDTLSVGFDLTGAVF